MPSISGKCKVDETPKGWFITLIHRDPKEELSEEKKLKRLAAEKEEEERHLAALNDQVGEMSSDVCRICRICY